MTFSIVASLCVHAAVMLWALDLWGSAKPFNTQSAQAMNVDLVPEAQAPKAPELPTGSPTAPELPTSSSKAPELPTGSPTAPELPTSSSKAPEPSSETAPTDKSSTQLPKDTTPQPEKEPRQAQVPVEKKPDPRTDRKQAALAQKPAEPPPAPEATAAPNDWLSGILGSPPTLPSTGFDGASPAEIGAKISRDTVAALRAHVQKCWVAPAGVAAALRAQVIIRVALKRNGEINGAPVLIQGPASIAGPAIMQSAIRALQECQPYNFLPVAEYKEWRVLDLSFTPRGLSGG
ncbi:MAG: hypothetical protein HY056_09230 [Proteobacteria bacterium]|nr:hypothetical protein [Pseudomonadota bacterium]